MELISISNVNVRYKNGVNAMLRMFNFLSLHLDNKLVKFVDGVDGLKTGHTDDAGYCLATTAKRGDLRLIGIILGEENSKVRNNEMIDLLDYGFNNVKSKVLKKKGEIIVLLKDTEIGKVNIYEKAKEHINEK